MPAAADAGADRLGTGTGEIIPGTVVQQDGTIHLHVDRIIEVLREGNLSRGYRDVDLPGVGPGFVRTPCRIGDRTADRRTGGGEIGELRAVRDAVVGHRRDRRGLVHRVTRIVLLQARGIAVLIILQGATSKVDGIGSGVSTEAALRGILRAAQNDRGVRVDGDASGEGVRRGEVHGRITATSRVHDIHTGGGVRAVRQDGARDLQRAAGRDGQGERLTRVGSGTEGDVTAEGGRAGGTAGGDLRRAREEVGDDHGVTRKHSSGWAEGEGDVTRAVRVTEAHHIGGGRTVTKAAVGVGRGEDVEQAVLEGHATGEGAAARERPSARTSLDEGRGARTGIGERMRHGILATEVGAAEGQAAGGGIGAVVPDRRGADIVEGTCTGGLDTGIAGTQLEETVDSETTTAIRQGTPTEDEVPCGRIAGAEDAGRTGVAE